VAVNCLQTALTLPPRATHPLDRAATLANLAQAFQLRRDLSSADRFVLARDAYDNALRLSGLDALPRLSFRILADYVQLLVEHGQHQDAAPLFNDLWRLHNLLWQREISYTSRTARLDDTAKLCALASFVSAILGRLPTAVEWTERGRNLLLRETQDRDRQLWTDAISPGQRQRYLTLVQRQRALEDEETHWGHPLSRPFTETVEEMRSVRAELVELIGEIRQTVPEFCQPEPGYRELRERIWRQESAAAMVFNITKYGAAVFLLVHTAVAEVEEIFFIPELTRAKAAHWAQTWTAGLDRLRRDVKQVTGKPLEVSAEIRALRERWDLINNKLLDELGELLEPVWDRLRPLQPAKLYLVPHGGLNILPLGLFRWRERGNWRRRGWLGDIYTCSTLSMIQRDQAVLPNGHFLGICNPTGDLPGSTDEVSNARGYFTESEILAGATATVAALLKTAPQAEVLHIGCHGMVDLIFPRDSHLLLAPGASELPAGLARDRTQERQIFRSVNGSVLRDISSVGRGAVETVFYDEDGRPIARTLRLADGTLFDLAPHESHLFIVRAQAMTAAQLVRELSLSRALLVVLAVCDGGRVSVESLADEHLSLADAVLAAGASSVISALWTVDDEAAKEFFKLLYDGLMNRRLSPARALGEAQDKLRADPHFASFFYWGGYQISG